MHLLWYQPLWWLLLVHWLSPNFLTQRQRRVPSSQRRILKWLVGVYTWPFIYSLPFHHFPTFVNEITFFLFFLFFKKLPRDEQNILEAASSGASASIGLVANIAANLIAFLAILGFINKALSWLGSMVGYPEITFQVWFNERLTTVLHFNYWIL